MNTPIPTAITCALLLTSATLCAKSITFRKEELKGNTIVTLDIKDQEKTVSGTFLFDQSKSREPSKPGFAFTGKVIPTPEGKSGIWMKIQFTGKAPLDKPWYVETVGDRRHLFMRIPPPKLQRSLSSS